MRRPNIPDSHHLRLICGWLMLVLAACGDRGNAGDSARGTLPPVFPLGPSSSTNWDLDAGPVMLISMGNGADSASVVLPEITDSTIATVQGNTAPVAGLVFDLFGRGGKVERSKAIPASRSADTTQECDAWPVAGVRTNTAGWRVGFARGHVQPIQLDSIEAMSSTDSAVLAASLAQTEPRFQSPRSHVQRTAVRVRLHKRSDSIRSM